LKLLVSPDISLKFSISSFNSFILLQKFSTYNSQ
jgi:hypothetical protein